jgi:hypothetical protein
MVDDGRAVDCNLKGERKMVEIESGQLAGANGGAVANWAPRKQQCPVLALLRTGHLAGPYARAD